MTQGKINVNRCNAADEDLIDVLTAISIVSMRLARKLTILAARSNSELLEWAENVLKPNADFENV